MTHFSASGDSIASLLITVRIGFERCTCILQLLICVAGPGYLLPSQDVVFLITAMSFDPFFIIVACLKAMQFVKLKA